MTEKKSGYGVRYGRLLLCLLFLAAAPAAQAQTPAINLQGVVNAATGRSASSVPVAARGSLVSIYGDNLSGTTASANRLPLPTQLPGTGTQVFFGGIAAPLFYVSPTQINAQVPFELPNSGSVDLVCGTKAAPALL